jgi:hypothetical protein
MSWSLETPSLMSQRTTLSRRAYWFLVDGQTDAESWIYLRPLGLLGADDVGQLGPALDAAWAGNLPADGTAKNTFSNVSLFTSTNVQIELPDTNAVAPLQMPAESLIRTSTQSSLTGNLTPATIENLTVPASVAVDTAKSVDATQAAGQAEPITAASALAVGTQSAAKEPAQAGNNVLPQSSLPASTASSQAVDGAVTTAGEQTSIQTAAGGTLGGTVYSWNSHALLNGVTTVVLGSGDPTGVGSSPLDFRNVHIDGSGHLVAELWANAGSGAGNFDITLGLPSGLTASFQSAALPTGWSIVQNGPTQGQFSLAGIGTTALTGSVQLGALTWTLPVGTTEADIALLSGDVGATAATPLSLSYATTTSDLDGSFTVSALTPDQYSVTASLAAGGVGHAITSADALAALKLAVGLDPNPIPAGGVQPLVSPFQFIAADVNGDGRVTAADALMILKMAVDLPGVDLPTWEFLNEAQTFWDPVTKTFTVNRSSVPTSFVSSVSVAGTSDLDLVGVLTGDVNGSWVPVDGSGNPIAGYATEPAAYFTALSAATGAPLDLWGIAASNLTLAAQLQDDTGVSASDGITSDPAIAGTATDPLGITALSVSVDGGAAHSVLADLQTSGSYQISAAALQALAGGTLPDGHHTIVVTATDAVGSISTSTVSLTLETSTPTPVFQLAAADQTGTAGQLQTNGAEVTLVGQAEAGDTVRLLSTGATTIASISGQFRFADVNLSVGSNALTVQATDIAGNTSSATQTITRSPSSAAVDPVLQWDQLTLNAITLDADAPTVASRALAMESLAVYDAIAAIDGTPGYLVNLSAPSDASAEAAVAEAADQVLDDLYPAQKASFDAQLTLSLSAISAGQSRFDGIALGAEAAQAIIALRANDGSSATVVDNGSTAVGQWRPTAPGFGSAMTPQWADVTPFALTSPDQFLPAAPPSLTSAAYAAAVNETESLGAGDSTTRTAAETQIALWWNDQTGTYTPPGEWNAIATSIAQSQGDSMATDAQILAELNVAEADAGIAAWNTKYTYNAWRPITAIPNANETGNSAIIQDQTWTPLLTTPPFPEYAAGHAVFSQAAAEVLNNFFGADTAFTATSPSLPGVTMSFTSFDEAAQQAGESRVYGGIHFQFSVDAGLALGQQVGDWALSAFNETQDTVPPKIVFNQISGLVTNTDPTITGDVTDNLSGVAGLAVSLDGGSATAVTFNSDGSFSVPTDLPTDGSADGMHTLTFTALDAAGNVTAPDTFTFTLDTLAPTISLSSDSIQNGGTLAAGVVLDGTVTPESAVALTALSYTIDGGTAMPLGFDTTTNVFDQALDLTPLTTGSHTITLSARDAAGNSTTETLDVMLPALPLLTVSSLTPIMGASNVGVTYRPEVTFSRAVDSRTVTSSSFYAADSTGAVIPATILMTTDGTGAYLLFTNPMPGASTITLHVDGSAIKAKADGALLDAAGSGTPGSELTETFTTVSTAPVANTTITGILADPGPDNTPMSPDDFKAAPDGASDFAKDIWKLPIAGVKVYVLGDEQDAVYTNAQGQFTLTDVPVGDVKVVFDGTTATNPPAGDYFPTMTMDLTNVRPGIVNTVMGSMGTLAEQQADADDPAVYLPRVASNILTPISSTTPTIITAPADTDFGSGQVSLTAQQLSQLSLTVMPGSVVDANGNPVANPTVGISPVPPAIVQDMLPPGVLQHTFDITIQAPDGAVFTQPATLTVPNTLGLAPGEKTFVLSFDHTTGRLVIAGTATVSADGSTITTDPGSGVTAPGWHGFTPTGVLQNTDVQVDEPPTEEPPPSPFDLVSLSADFTLAVAWQPLILKGDFSVNIPALANQNVTFFDNTTTIQSSPGGWLSYSGVINDKLTASGLNADATFDIPSQPFTADYTYSTPSVIVPEFLAQWIEKYFPINIFTAQATVGVSGSATISGAIGASLNLHKLYLTGKVGLGLTANASAMLNSSLLSSLPYIGQYFSQSYSISIPLAGLPTYSLSQSFPLPASFNTTINQSVGVSASVSASSTVNASADISLVEGTPQDNQAVSESQAVAALSSVSGSLDQYPNFTTITSIGTDPRVYYRYVMSDGTNVAGASDENGVISVFLPADTGYMLYLYQPSTDSSGILSGMTGSSGSTTTQAPKLEAVGGPDSNGDGIPDTGKFVLGIDPTKPDGSIVPGLSDIAALAGGLMDGRSTASFTGIAGSVALSGVADALVLAGSATNAEQQTAYVATAGFGLAIVDVSNTQSPDILSQLQLDGTSTDLDVDPNLQFAAVADGNAGLAIIDVSEAKSPRLVQNIAVDATVVKIFNGIAYANDGTTLDAIDLFSGEILQRLALAGATLTGLALDGTTLYAMDANDNLTVIDLSSGQMVQQGSIHLSYGGDRIFAANGVVYIGAESINTAGGYLTVDVSNPASPKLIENPDDRGIGGAALALNGSGLGVSVQQGVGVSGTVNFIDVFNASNPKNTGQFLTQYTLPSRPYDVAIGEGVAFVADGSSGLQVVNYTSIDTTGVGPTITVLQEPGGNPAGTAAISMTEGSDATFQVSIADPGQVRNVALLVNGTVAINAVSYPFDLSTILPSIAANGSNQVTLTVQATDTAGNIATTSPVTVTLLRDTTPPTLLDDNIPAGSIRGQSYSFFTFDFSKPLDPTTVTAANFELTGPDGTAVTPTSIQLRTGNRSVEVTYPQLPLGIDQFILNAGAIADTAGNFLGSSPITTSFTVEPYSDEWINASGGVWTASANWSSGTAPGPTDDVLFGPLASAYTATIVAGASVAVHSLTLNAAGSVLQDNGTLALDGVLQVLSGTFDLAGTVTFGGTIVANGGSVIIQNGTLNNVTYEGTLDLSSNSESLRIVNSTTFEGVNGSGPGTINLTGAGSSLYIGGSATLDNATINMGNASSYDYLYAGLTGSGQTLTLGPHLTLNVTGHYDQLSQYNGSSTIVNQGTIALGAGDTLYIQPATFTNAPGGTITVAAAAALYLENTITAGSLSGVSNNGGIVYLDANFTNTGSTLVVGSGSSLGSLALGGTILGGVLQDKGSGLIAQSGTLNDVAYEGTLDLSGNNESLRIVNGTTFEGTNGSGPGTINLTGAGSSFYIGGSATLDNANINMGNASAYDYLYAGLTGAGQTLTLGSQLTLNVTGRYAQLGQNYGSSTVVNQGIMNIESSGGQFFVEATNFINSAQVDATNAATLDFAQSVSGTGTFDVSEAAKIDFANHLDSGATMSFIGGGGTIEIDQGGQYAANINGFVASDDLDFRGLHFSSLPQLTASPSGLDTLITLSDGADVATLSFGGIYFASNFKMTNDGFGGILLTHT